VWVAGVEIPADLVDAHRAGRLVLFVGAGASRDAPSDLPDFETLTRSIARETHYVLHDGDLKHPDVVLGRIADLGVDVHLRISEHLSPPQSKHNRLHEAIVDLALGSPAPRIVTTNFDRHLTSAIAARGATVEEYAAPALPMGNDFTGIVYLHGHLLQSPNRLVVTEGDFGRAYLRDAWAARFLERMFAEFSVLFIGYSHGDVVMRYLARALGPNGKRHVMTHNPTAHNWRELGLKPIGYEVVSNSHEVLGDALSRWAEIVGMGLLDHRQRIAELVSAPPSGIPEEMSYLEDVVTKPDRAQLFTKLARSSDWLEWASTQPVFKRLFYREAHPSDVGMILAGWFVENFVMSEEHTDLALRIAAEDGGFLGPEVCSEIGRQLSRRGKPRPGWLGAWLVLLLRDSPSFGSHWLEYALRDSEWPTEREQILLLFDHLTEPVATLMPSFGLGRRQLDVHLVGDAYWLHEAWEQILKPNLADVAPSLAALADRKLRQIRDLQLTAHPSACGWDTLSFGRHAIEPHQQDVHSESIDLLIDVARDALEALIDASHPLAAWYIQSWAETDSRILQRIAVHAWAYRKDVDPSAKIDWAVKSGMLFDHWVHHEIFRVIAIALPDASDRAVDALISAVEEPGEHESEHRPYERFNLLVWMDRCRPGHQRIASALEAAHAVNPSWQVRTDPDLTHSAVAGAVPSRPPMTVEQFHDRLAVDPSALLEALRQYQDASPWEGGPTWEDSLTLITSAIQAEPSDGFPLLDVEPQDVVVARSVINGWSRALLDDAERNTILERITALDLGPLVREVSEMLAYGGRSERHPTEWAASAVARQLAVELWRLLPEGEEDSSPDAEETLTRAINHPAGYLAEFWLRVVEHDWRASVASWSGLTVAHRKVLEMMLNGLPGAHQTQLAAAICVGRLNFLFAADPEWTVEKAMPYLDWSVPAQAHWAWSSFTTWGRWNDPMLDAGLMNHYLETVRHLGEFDPSRQKRILGHVAGIALLSERDPLEWVPRIIADLGDDERTMFATKVADVLQDLPAEVVEHQWSRWIQRYWCDRLRSVPAALSFDEATAMTEWTAYLTESFESGVQLVTTRPGRLPEHADLLRRLEPHIDSSPDACARLIGHLMRHTEPPWWGGVGLLDMIPRLRAGSDPSHMKEIEEQAMRLRIPLRDD
jgi:hypothetical protein